MSLDDQFDVRIPAGKVTLAGTLNIPPQPTGVVAFAHGSGSSRFSPRNRFVSNLLHYAHLATLLLDLLTESEEKIDARTAELRFDIGLLSERLLRAGEWLSEDERTRDLKLGYFGASTGAAAALVASAESDIVSAIVSRGGRPDLAGDALSRVKAPTLLIVGGNDVPVIDMNRQAFEELRCEKSMEIIPGATHLFEETGALAQVAHLAQSWFGTYLRRQEAREAA